MIKLGCQHPSTRYFTMESYLPIIFHLKEIASLYKRTGKFATTPEDCYSSNTPINDIAYEVQGNRESHKVSISRKPFQPITCCGICFRLESHYRRHLTTIYHKARLERTCSVCAKYFINKKLLAIHRNKHHSRSQHYKCQVCGKSFNNNVLLTKHMKDDHTSSLSVKCDNCPYVTWKGSNLARHKAKCKPAAALDPNPGPAHVSRSGFEPTVCCGTTFKYPSFLKRHREFNCKVVKAIKPCCKVCNEYFDGDEALHQHRKDAHSEWICMLCNEKFASNGGLTVHLKAVHIKSTVFECKKCSFSSARKDALNRHSQRFHTEQEPNCFYCETCRRMFRRKDHLQIHQKIHLKNTPHCEICSISYKTVKDLEKHKLVHRPCQICGMKFKLAKHRESHLRKHVSGRLKN